MTCIVAFKQNDNTYIAGDMLGSDGYSKKLIAQPKVFKNGNLYIGYTTTFRYGQVLEHVWTPPRHIAQDKSDMRYLVEDVVPSLISCLKSANMKELEGHQGFGECVIVYNKSIYRMQADNSMLPYEDFACCGSGEISAAAIMEWHTKDGQLNNSFSVEKLFETLSKVCVGVSKEHVCIKCE